MTAAVRWDGRSIVLDLDDSWRRLIADCLGLLDELADSEAVSRRLKPPAHPHDPVRDEAFRASVDGQLHDARAVDRAAISGSLDRRRLDVDLAESWMRVLGDIRLAVASRGEVDEAAMSRESDETTWLIRMLGHLQDQFVQALSAAHFQAG